MKVNTKSKAAVVPVLDGIYVGSRLAAVVSPYGMGAGWDHTAPTLVERADYYDHRSAEPSDRYRPAWTARTGVPAAPAGCRPA